MRAVRLLIIGWAVLAMLSCIPSDGELPTVTPIPPTTPPTEEPGPDETPEPGPAPDGDQVERLWRATVQIVALEREGGRLQPLWTGSGTILTPSGMILTNAHVAGDPDPAYQPDALGVSLTVRDDEPPEPTYLAELQAIDYQLDLAVLQVVSDLNGSPIDADQLNLPYVPVGNSDLVKLGDTLEILGYPGIGGETITFTEGVVSGFTRERDVEGRAWVKTDASISGGNSGGLGANQHGEIVGVPTQAGHGGAKRYVDCRYLADTNGDGVINENDNCIPVGGFINALRPINLAKPLIESARTGVGPGPEPGPGPSPQPSGQARFYNLVFAPDVTEDDQPVQIVSQLPSGATGIYVFWDYEGMASGMNWEARWYHQDEYVDSVSQPPGPWRGGERGTWWIGFSNPSGLPDGTYRIELIIEGKSVEDSISLGGTIAGPTITNLRFSADPNDDQPANPFLLPSGITAAYAFFDYDSMSNGMSWRRVWYYEGQQAAEGRDTWDEGASGSTSASISGENPLSPGTYRLEIFVEGTLVAAANFAVAGTQDQGAIGPITFAAGIDGQGNPVNPAASFASGLLELHYFFDYTGMQNGMNIRFRWILNDEEVFSRDVVWAEGESGTFSGHLYQNSGDPLPDGSYTLELYVEGQKVQQGSTTIGTAAPPTPTPAPTGGLYIQGHIRDADTGLGIPGALFVVLRPGLAFDAWDGSADDVYTAAETDANGYFELPDPLARGESYTLIIWAEGYTGIHEDNILIGDEPSPVELDIELQRQ